MRFFQLLVLFFVQISSAQSTNPFAAVDTKMSKIPEDQTRSTSDIANYINSNFTSESDKIRAAFYWTASNISYDVENMNEPNFIYTPQEKIASALKTKKGVCIHYAEVFSEIANKLGIKTHIIGGYTKQNGVVTPISHAWCGSKVDGKWQLFDPTWASGFVNGKKFTKKFNNFFYKTEPSKLIQSHMPFDYMWQFLSRPLTNREFFTGKLTEEKPITNYDYAAEIAKYEQLTDEQKAFDEAQRVEKNGVFNNFIAEYLAIKKNDFTVLNQNKNIEKFNLLVEEYNQAIFGLNDFIYYRNRQFKPALPDEEIWLMIENPYNKLKKCQEDMYKINSVGKENYESFSGLKKSIIDATKQAEEHYNFVKEYLTKSKSGRKAMFTKVKIFGIPMR
ncbi:transglutaminase domain-containing protein [Flavobacterium sp.]|uniref:transglutaminase domain-containing protein n=1 Tax=Flavobacterium sp. TaxID=239 RepID=UPI002B4B8EE5|nr:transglutaminase domain-containing protein [Flavobacterium sp.]HLP65820.1 transglutaminase domain-containing protein [Flavobacterium sp.]